MSYFNHIACTALEQLFAKAHPHNLSSLVVFFVFQERTHHGAFMWGSPTIPSQYCWHVGWCPVRMEGWCENHGQFVPLWHPFSSLLFHDFSGLHAQRQGSAEATAKSGSCHVPGRKHCFVVFGAAHESWRYSELYTRKQAETTCISGGKEIHIRCTINRFVLFLFMLLIKYSVLYFRY